MDHVVNVLTLCTIPAVDRALAEIRRVLRPAGAFHLMEHGLSPQETVARWQHRLTPLQRRVFGGCRINRPIDRLVAGAGLELTRLDNYYLKGPRAFGYMFDGAAAKLGGQSRASGQARQAAAMASAPTARPAPTGGLARSRLDCEPAGPAPRAGAVGESDVPSQ